MAIDQNGNIIICGWTSSADFPVVNAYNKTHGGIYEGMGWSNDVFVIKFASDGETILFSTFIGGEANEQPQYLFVDENGYIIVGGWTSSPDFPTKNAFDNTYSGENKDIFDTDISDIFLFKLSPDGQNLIFSTFLGGSDDDFLSSMVITEDGSILLAGSTGSGDFPTFHGYDEIFGGNNDIFLTQISSDGQSLEFSTLMGGHGRQEIIDLVIDPNGDIIIIGSIWQMGFESGFLTKDAFNDTYAGDSDSFLVKFSSNGQELLFSTFLGGSGVSHLSLDSDGDIILGGSQWLHNNKDAKDVCVVDWWNYGCEGDYQIFLFKLSSNGQEMIFHTSIDGMYDERLVNMDVDPTGAIIFSGWTLSQDFPLFNAINSSNSGTYSYICGPSGSLEGDGFLAKLSPDGQKFIFSTFLGGSEASSIAELTIDHSNNIIIAGLTLSNDFPQINTNLTSNTTNDIFLQILSPNGDKILHSDLLSQSKQYHWCYGDECCWGLSVFANIKVIILETKIFFSGCGKDCGLYVLNSDSNSLNFINLNITTESSAAIGFELAIIVMVIIGLYIRRKKNCL
ncbi:MAG: hypothetical protein ACXAC7_04765 [Candidatus Hodarchaeales archaeon]|jgi:hypothetical protein